ncbi:hypothetical protein BKA62DRAFT_669455 [Auriculariales sp. MPI-PUGE-AT-0066]|nr:hypothetical protein BKA62DRAFT_669455 [Auriculariales sp. MPI-PUGE-AT-0066]
MSAFARLSGAVALVAFLAQSANAHMLISEPAPFRYKDNPQYAGSALIDYSYTAPLNKDGSNFPCKGYHVDLGTVANAASTLKAGSDYKVTMGGTATHNGGSCQFALSYNGGADWGSGNREMYMNCAPVNVESSGTGLTVPRMFEANVFGEDTCTTIEGKDIDFTKPGESMANCPADKLITQDNVVSFGAGGAPAPADPAPTPEPTETTPTEPTEPEPTETTPTEPTEPEPTEDPSWELSPRSLVMKTHRQVEETPEPPVETPTEPEEPCPEDEPVEVPTPTPNVPSSTSTPPVATPTSTAPSQPTTQPDNSGANGKYIYMGLVAPGTTQGGVRGHEETRLQSPPALFPPFLLTEGSRYGGGPAAFYTASRILSTMKESSSVLVHMYDRLWAPHGLVRYGVAPDHPEVKNCTNKFDKTAEDPRFTFFGNVNIISPVSPSPRISHALDVPIESILSHYTHLLLATGSALPVTHPRLQANATCVPALNIVHWYTQHPFATLPPDLKNTSHVTIIGHGNVSLDIARMLLTPVDMLRQYDIPEHVLQVLSESNVKHVSIVGRRDPAGVKFTAKEAREMMNIPGVSMVPIPSDLFPIAGTELSRQQSRILDILRTGSKTPHGSAQKTFSIDFMRSPAASNPAARTLTFDVTRLDADGRAQATGDTETTQTDLTVMSMGYAGEPMSSDTDVSWYDSTLGHLRTRAGQVFAGPTSRLKNVYAAGWAAHGARGVINTTMMDSYAVAQRIIGDYIASGDAAPEDIPPARPGVATSVPPLSDEEVEEIEVMNSRASMFSLPPEIITGQHAQGGGRVLTYKDWKLVDAAEQERGKTLNKERERMGYWEAVKLLA